MKYKQLNIMLLLIGLTLVISSCSTENYDDQGAFDTYRSMIDSENISSCDHEIDADVFPEIITLESECHYILGMQSYELGDLENASFEFNQSLDLSDTFTNDIQIMLDGIQLIVSIPVPDRGLVIDFDISNDYSMFYDVQAFFDIYPSTIKDDVLIQNVFLPQILGSDVFHNDDVSLYALNTSLITNIPTFDSANPDRVSFQATLDGDDNSGIDASYGVILMEDSEFLDLSYRYLIVDLDTIKIYSYITQTEYTLNRINK